MKQLLAVIFTGAILIAAVWLGRGPSAPAAATATGAPEDDGPAACLERMFAAAEQADIPAFLACFTGEEREKLDREVAAQSADTYGRSLQAALQALKARAVHAPQAIGDQMVDMRVERIYTGRIEQQVYRLREQRGAWYIESVRAYQTYQPVVPFGTHVSEEDGNVP